MKDPHVGVFVRDMQSQSGFRDGRGAKAGIFQIRGNKTLLEILSLAEGLADDAGEDVIILRRAGQKKRARVLFCESERVGGIFRQ